MAKKRINYSQVDKKINELAGKLNNLDRQISEINKIRINLASKWQGKAGAAYIRKLDSLFDDMKATRNQFYNMIQQMLAIRDSLKRADENAQQNYNSIKSSF